MAAGEGRWNNDPSRHCATAVPARYRDELVIGDDELARELLLMTDHDTDELAMSAVARSAHPAIRFHRSLE